MRESLKTKFSTRQYMLSEDFEIYYYSDRCVKKIENHTHSYCEFYLFLEGKVSMVIEGEPISLKKGDVVVILPVYPITRGWKSLRKRTVVLCFG